MRLRRGILAGSGLHRDNIFNLLDEGNRDRCFEPYILLASLFRTQGVTLHTPDMAFGGVVFELHMDVRPATLVSKPAYLMLLETPLIYPANIDVPKHYQKVFTWDDTRADGDRYIKFNYPNSMAVPALDGFTHRERFCCLIAGNKSPTQHDARELYSERVRAIRWFENNAPEDFDLYGTDWDLPPAKPGFPGRVKRRLWRQLSRWVQMKPFPSYRGKVQRKFDVLRRTRFSICYENMRDMPGYITEKLFDCFFAGCVPVYWGANNVGDHVPPDCFIDRRQFEDAAAVYKFLKAIDEKTFIGYQQRIASFIASDAAKPFSAEAFAETIVSTIVQDLGRIA